MIDLHLGIQLAELLVVVGAVAKILAYLSRIKEALTDFPPHRHVDGSILYPKGFEPGVAARGAAFGNGD
jgi:hypothetical protein